MNISQLKIGVRNVSQKVRGSALACGAQRYVTKAQVAGFMLSLAAAQTWAQVGGGTGTGADVEARVLGTMTVFQAIMFGIGGLVISAAGMWTGYGMATGTKKWSDCANVCYGAGFAGCAVMISGWLFS